MMNLISENILPRIERLEKQNQKLELKFNTKPQIDIEIESTDIEKLVDAMKQLYSNFGLTTNLNVKATLKEAADSGV